MAKKVKLPPVPEERTVTLTKKERHLLEGLLSWYRDEVVRQRDEGEISGEAAKAMFDLINATSEKLVPEEEAARMLQDLGFEIVEKGA